MVLEFPPLVNSSGRDISVTRRIGEMFLTEIQLGLVIFFLKGNSTKGDTSSFNSSGPTFRITFNWKSISPLLLNSTRSVTFRSFTYISLNSELSS